MTPLALFDLDGTLVDSAPGIRIALNRILSRRGLAPYGLPEVTAMIGDGAKVLVERAFAGRGVRCDPAAVAEFVGDENLTGGGLARPYPGVVAALDILAGEGWRLAVCTNKPGLPARALLASLGLVARFAAIGAGDSFPARKPDPAHVLGTIRLAGGDPARSVMVGDHANDVAAATGAGVASVFASWGYGTPAMAAGASAAVRHPAELTEALPRLLA